MRYAGASGDFNPIHWDEHAAERAGRSGVIAHGILIVAIAARVLTTWAGEGAVTDYRARFGRPVVVPAEGTAVVTVAGVASETLVDGRVLVELSVLCLPDRGARRCTGDGSTYSLTCSAHAAWATRLRTGR